MSEVLIEKAKDLTTISQVKLVADKHRPELGFHSRQTFTDSSAKNELLVAKIGGKVQGFVRFHHRRDHLTTLYEIATAPDVRGKGVGRRLVDALVSDCNETGSRCIRLFCPVELPANQFYEKLGFVRSSRRSHPGKSRPLNEWILPVLPHRPISFVASLTSCTRDLKHLTSTWEAEGPGGSSAFCARDWVTTARVSDSSSKRELRQGMFA